MTMDVDKETAETGVELTEAENELYDRQIRLWGLESQKRYVYQLLILPVPFCLHIRKVQNSKLSLT